MYIYVAAGYAQRDLGISYLYNISNPILAQDTFQSISCKFNALVYPQGPLLSRKLSLRGSWCSYSLRVLHFFSTRCYSLSLFGLGNFCQQSHVAEATYQFTALVLFTIEIALIEQKCLRLFVAIDFVFLT